MNFHSCCSLLNLVVFIHFILVFYSTHSFFSLLIVVILFTLCSYVTTFNTGIMIGCLLCYKVFNWFMSSFPFSNAHYDWLIFELFGRISNVIGLIASLRNMFDLSKRENLSRFLFLINVSVSIKSFY